MKFLNMQKVSHMALVTLFVGVSVYAQANDFESADSDSSDYVDYEVSVCESDDIACEYDVRMPSRLELVVAMYTQELKEMMEQAADGDEEMVASAEVVIDVCLNIFAAGLRELLHQTEAAQQHIFNALVDIHDAARFEEDMTDERLVIAEEMFELMWRSQEQGSLRALRCYVEASMQALPRKFAEIKDKELCERRMLEAFKAALEATPVEPC